MIYNRTNTDCYHPISEWGGYFAVYQQVIKSFHIITVSTPIDATIDRALCIV